MPRWQEAGHAHRLEAALAAHLPSADSFSFALRVNADMLAADGGVEALATSAASLALRDAGAPLDHLVTGSIPDGYFELADFHIFSIFPPESSR
jgi:polyribonucleotide nucleotidyltransferase